MKTNLSRRHFFEPALGTVMLLLIPGCGGGGDANLAEAAANLGVTPSTAPVATTPVATTPVATTPVATTPVTTTQVSTPPSVPSASCGSTFDFNHGHVLLVLRTDLNSTTAVSYDITGTSNHSHTVTLSVDQLATLKTGAAVTVSSTVAFGHQHVITVSCV